MATKRQIEVQIGNQALFGTAVAPTVYLAGISAVSMPPSIVTERQQVLRGTLGPGKNIVTPRHESRGVSLTGSLIYEQEMYYLDGAAQATPAGAGPYTYAYAGPTGTAASPRTQTLVAGTSTAAWGLTGARLATYALSWSWGELVERTATWMGYAVEDDALAALTEPTDANTTEGLGCHALVYVDAWGGAMGSTAMTKALSGTFNLDLQRQYLPYLGSCYPSGTYDSNGWDFSGALSLELDATSAAFADAYVGAVLRKLIRIKFTNGGAAAAERSLTLDLRAEVTIDELITDNNELLTVDLSYKAIQDEADNDEYLDMTLINNTATAY